MTMSPIDIEQKTFRVALRGYAEEEVDQFLDEIVVAIREYERQLRDANERVAVLEEQLEANRETEERIKKTLLIAQRTADQVVQEARGEAQQVLAEARSKASEVEVEQIQERENLVADLDRMRGSVASLKDRIMGLADETMGKLEAIEGDIVTARPEPKEHGASTRDLGETDDRADFGAHEEVWREDVDLSAETGEEHDQPEESAGQVVLGSGLRPWDRDDSDA